MAVVSNSSPLIYLANIHLLDLLPKLFRSLEIPSEVYEEVVERGMAEGYSDAVLIRNAIHAGWIQVISPKKKIPYLEHFGELDIGERAAIERALERSAEMVLIDDAAGRQAAKAIGLQVRGTVYVLILAYQKKILTLEETKQSIGNLLEAGFRLAPELYVKILRELEKE